jgi:hypothetical protein
MQARIMRALIMRALIIRLVIIRTPNAFPVRTPPYRMRAAATPVNEDPIGGFKLVELFYCLL